MAYVKVATLAIFGLAIFCVFSMKEVGAVDCSGACSPFEMPPCRSSSCRCIPILIVFGYCTYPSSLDVKNIAEKNPNLCQSHDDCIKKESGSFCARYLNSDIEYGWCFASSSEAKDTFFKIYSNTTFANELKMSATL
ncbi:hypothetical protein RYX36_029156 [Vicia faba]